MTQVKLDDRMHCDHVFKRPDEDEDDSAPADRRYDVAKQAGIIKLVSRDGALRLKEMLGIKFRDLWEADPNLAALIPSEHRGMGTMDGAVYCTEHRALSIPITHPGFGADTVAVVLDFDLPPCIQLVGDDTSAGQADRAGRTRLRAARAQAKRSRRRNRGR